MLHIRQIRKLQQSLCSNQTHTPKLDFWLQQSISLLKKEIVEQTAVANKDEFPKQKPAEFNGLINLLTDSNVSSMIKSVAGEDTQILINNALNDVGAGRDKKEVLSESIRKLKTNFTRDDNIKVIEDPKFKLALSLVGLTKGNLAGNK